MNPEPLQYNRYYHIYNRGINGCSLYHRVNDYKHFLNLYDKYIEPIAETFAWCLMGNHFHFLIKTKREDEIRVYMQQNADRSVDSVRLRKNLSVSEGSDSVKTKRPNLSRQFAHLFNAYAKYYNKVYKRTGALFERPFNRVDVFTKEHLQYLVYYIHHNPVHHGFCEDMLEYPWSSYLTILSPKASKLNRKQVLEWYNSNDNYKNYHNTQSVNRFNQLQIDSPT